MDWLQNLAPTLVGLLGASIGWFLKSRLEAKRRDQEALRDERAKIYVDILMPFIRIFTDLSKSRQQESLKEVKSLDYRKLAFRLALIGDDEVVRAWNGLWNSLYRMETENTASPTALLLSLGDVLLAIRRGLGIKNTRLSNKDMLRWIIKDIDTLKGV
jgi:hypothetical protein